MLQNLCCLNTSLCRCRCLPSVPLTNNKRIKLGYILFILLGYASLLLANYAWPEPIETSACPVTQPESSCSEHSHAVIIYTAFALFHLSLAGAMLCRSDKVKLINEGLWLPKALAIMILVLMVRLLYPLIASFLSSVTAVFAVALYLFISMVYIDLIYAADAQLDVLATHNNKLYLVRIVLTLIGFATAVWLCVWSWGDKFEWIHWTHSGLLFLFVILAVLRLFQGNSILVGCMVSLMLGVTAFYLPNPDPPLLTSFLTLFRSLAVLFLLLGMVCQGSNKLRTRKSSLNELLCLNTSSSDEDHRYVSSHKWTIYHLTMAIICLGIPAALSPDNPPVSSSLYEAGHYTWWGATLAMYLWALVTSRLFPQRDFSELENYFREYELQ